MWTLICAPVLFCCWPQGRLMWSSPVSPVCRHGVLSSACMTPTWLRHVPTWRAARSRWGSCILSFQTPSRSGSPTSPQVSVRPSPTPHKPDITAFININNKSMKDKNNVSLRWGKCLESCIITQSWEIQRCSYVSGIVNHKLLYNLRFH